MSNSHLSKLYNSRYAQQVSTPFIREGFSIFHTDSSLNTCEKIGNQSRNASLPLLDGLGIVLAGGLKKIGVLMGKVVMIEIDKEIYNHNTSFVLYEMPRNLVACIERKGDEILISSNLPSTGKNPTPGEGGLGPFVFPLLLAETMNEFLSGNVSEAAKSPIMLSAWSEFLKLWNNRSQAFSSDDKDKLCRAIINMSDYAYEGLVTDMVSMGAIGRTSRNSTPVRAEYIELECADNRNGLLKFLFDVESLQMMLEMQSIKINNALGVA